jgi:hypothetical protein
MNDNEQKIETSLMGVGKLYLVSQVNAPKPQRAPRGRSLQSLLASPFESLTPREQNRVFRHHSR